MLHGLESSCLPMGKGRSQRSSSPLPTAAVAPFVTQQERHRRRQTLRNQRPGQLRRRGRRHRRLPHRRRSTCMQPQHLQLRCRQQLHRPRLRRPHPAPMLPLMQQRQQHVQPAHCRLQPGLQAKLHRPQQWRQQPHREPQQVRRRQRTMPWHRWRYSKLLLLLLLLQLDTSRRVRTYRFYIAQLEQERKTGPSCMKETAAVQAAKNSAWSCERCNLRIHSNQRTHLRQRGFFP